MRVLFPSTIIGIFFAAVTAAAQPPAEVAGVGFPAPATISWSASPAADVYHVYRGDLVGLVENLPGRCHGFAIEATSFASPAAPEPGAGYFYLVTAESTVDGEGTAGTDSSSNPRLLQGACRPVMRTHLLNRLGYGWNEWSRDRLAVLGFEGYIDDQLEPRFIDETTNADLNTRLAPIDPPSDIVQLVQQQLIRGVYARRQLEQQAASFWANHFNTDWSKIENLYQGAFPPCQTPGVPPECDENFPARAYLEASLNQYDEIQSFRRLAFRGNFRQMVEASALSPAMIIYLDTIASSVGIPNENFPRELLELYTMGVSGGYTQTDVEEMARVLTGWRVCKKELDDVDDPLAPCLGAYWEELPLGKMAPAFLLTLHDCGEKVLFGGTPQETTIPDTCDSPVNGVDDLFLALDAIAAHPSTARFISKKILQRFVTDTPSEAQIDELVAVWNDNANPHGVGDLQAVLAAALKSDAFLDPDRVRSKVKTPMEQFISTLRAIRGRIDSGDLQTINSLVAAQHIPHYNPVPTGWPETGASWIGTNNSLERQNYPIWVLSSIEQSLGGDPFGLLADNGISTAPGNSEAIVDFLSDVFFGGALAPAERQRALDYLNTDYDGLPSPYDDLRILETVVLLLGYPQFQEQ